jgi:hypothetical protein
MITEISQPESFEDIVANEEAVLEYLSSLDVHALDTALGGEGAVFTEFPESDPRYAILNALRTVDPAVGRAHMDVYVRVMEKLGFIPTAQLARTEGEAWQLWTEAMKLCYTDWHPRRAC